MQKNSEFSKTFNSIDAENQLIWQKSQAAVKWLEITKKKN